MADSQRHLHSGCHCRSQGRNVFRITVIVQNLSAQFIAIPPNGFVFLPETLVVPPKTFDSVGNVVEYLHFSLELFLVQTVLPITIVFLFTLSYHSEEQQIGIPVVCFDGTRVFECVIVVVIIVVVCLVVMLQDITHMSGSTVICDTVLKDGINNVSWSLLFLFLQRTTTTRFIRVDDSVYSSIVVVVQWFGNGTNFPIITILTTAIVSNRNGCYRQ